MSLTDYGFTRSGVETVFLLTVCAAAVLIVFSIFLRTVRARAVYGLLRENGRSRAWFAFVPVLSDEALGALGSVYAGKKCRAAGRAAAVLTVLQALMFVTAAALAGSALIRLVYAADSAYASGAERLEESAWRPVYNALSAAAVWLALWAARQLLRAVCLFCIYRGAGAPAAAFTLAGLLLPFLTPLFLQLASGKARAGQPGESSQFFV